MNLKINGIQLAVTLCLMASQGVAEIAPSALSSETYSSLKSNNSNVKVNNKFELPKELEKSQPSRSLKQIYDMSKKGDFNNRPRLGGMDGGGGKVLLCPTGNGKIKAKVLDVYEGEAAGLKINMGTGNTVQEKIDYVLNRLSRIAPNRARAYSVWIVELLNQDSAFYEDAILPVTDDAGVTVLPVNCQIVQVVVQRNNQDADIPGFARYLFDKDVFLQLDLDSKVALILHEVIYREARARGETNSLRARYLNYLILSQNMEQMSFERFNEILKKMGSKCLEINGVLGQYCNDQLPDVYVEQNFDWNGRKFSGLMSISNYTSKDSAGLRIKTDSYDLSSLLKSFYPSLNLQIRVLKTREGVLKLTLSNDSFDTEEKTELMQIIGEKFVLTGACYLGVRTGALSNIAFICSDAELEVKGQALQKNVNEVYYFIDSNGIPHVRR